MRRDPDKGAETGDHEVQEIARQITVERDPVRLAVLCKKLDQIMLADEREKVQRRLKESA